ncbi:MAG: STAS domain-containing protein [Clostridia bacterium]|nr:STAS domain-containing protein [Clostridia bacterium]
MGVEILSNALRVTALLSGEIDHHTAAAIRMDIDSAISAQQPKTLRLDFTEVSFMDSSAIGLVMGRYRLLQAWGGQLEVVNLSDRNYKVMKLAGMQSLCMLKRKDEENESD